MIGNLLNSILGKLANEAVKKFRQIQEVGDKVDRLTRELRRLQAILEDADNKKIKTKSEKPWVKELINVAWDIEDVLDHALLLKVAPQGETSKTEGSLSIFKKPRKLSALDNLSYQIDRILARIDEIFESRERYGIHNLGEGSGEEAMLPLKPHMIPDVDDPNVVGLDAHKQRIVEALLDQNTKRRSVVSIVGIGGIGKTTLARKVYNSIEVKEEFHTRIWVVVSQNFELADIVRKMLEQIGAIHSSEQRNDVQYFLTKLYRSLSGKKYLLVLDEVWTEELWYHIEEALVDPNNGSRVLVTSRNKNVAWAANSSLAPYELPLFSEEDGLQLLLKKAQYNPDLKNNANSHHLLDIATKLVKRCDGLPLALVVLGGLLSRHPPEYIVWSNILQTMSWSTDGNRCVHIIGTSYDDLPLALKFCFMYFAAFPEDHEIWAPELIQMWVAEGLVPQEENKTMEETARMFLNDLAQRSMVQVLGRSYDNTIDSCQVHDLLRDLAVEKAKGLNFFTVCSKEDEEQSYREARRLAVHYSDCESPNLRTLLCFNSRIPNCTRHKLLKVLSDMGHLYKSDPNHIEGLTQLRYLKIFHHEYNHVEAHFTKLINNMKFLQTLDIRYTTYDNGLSDFIWDIKTLRHVMLLPNTFGPPAGSNMRNLQTLTGVKSRESWETTAVPTLPNLHTLQINISKECSLMVVMAFLHTLKSLIHLDLRSKIPLDVLDTRGFPFYPRLTSLSLNGKFFHDTELTVDVTMFFIHLTKLTLFNCEMHHDPMAFLDKLYYLKYLYLCSAIDRRIQKIRCSAGGFPRLEYLSIKWAKKLEEWEIEDGAMPRIQTLIVSFCPMLQVPVGLQCLTTLYDLTWGIEPEIMRNLRSGTKAKEDKIRKLCTHVPHITFN